MRHHKAREWLTSHKVARSLSSTEFLKNPFNKIFFFESCSLSERERERERERESLGEGLSPQKLWQKKIKRKNLSQ